MQTATAGYAGFWKRFAAYLIDELIIGAAALVVLLPFLFLLGLGGIFSMREPDISYDSEVAAGLVFAMAMGYAFLALGVWVANWLYFALMEASKFQGTLGKMALGIKVTDMSGEKVSFGRATGRYFAKIISSLTFGIGYIMAGFTQQKQGLHDIIAGCLVVNK